MSVSPAFTLSISISFSLIQSHFLNETLCLPLEGKTESVVEKLRENESEIERVRVGEADTEGERVRE
jgi:hypothetical protein